MVKQKKSIQGMTVVTLKQKKLASRQAIKLLGTFKGPKYKIRNLYDEKQDKNAVYLVLRLDKMGHDQVWSHCCRTAARQLAKALEGAGMEISARKLRKAIKVCANA